MVPAKLMSHWLAALHFADNLTAPVDVMYLPVQSTLLQALQLAILKAPLCS